jgi:hypothetical protein
MGTREGLERLAHPVDRKRYLLEIVETINQRDGTYGVAGKMLEDVFQDELRKELSRCPREKFEAMAQDLDREKIEEEVEPLRGALEAALDQKLEGLKEKDPQDFASRFGEGGASAEERERMIQEMAEAEVKHRIL